MADATSACDNMDLKQLKISDGLTFKYIRNDLPSGLVVFLVALPLCLGIALASGAPLFSGIITGMVGGMVVAFASGSSLSVSGPAAGLTVIVHKAITDLGSYETFLLAVVLAGLIQVILGYLRAGIIGYYFPSNVIKGMLAAIGIILILKQIPHAVGYDVDNEGDEDFFQADGENTITEILNSVDHVHAGAIVIAAVSLFVLIMWDQPVMKRLSFTKVIPGALVAVIMGIIINAWFGAALPSFHVTGDRLVQLPF
jgi:MFS superfamily sulfate permease-like transporter